jgi:hypothetical protein
MMQHNEVIIKYCPICTLQEKNCKQLLEAGIKLHDNDDRISIVDIEETKKRMCFKW